MKLGGNRLMLLEYVCEKSFPPLRFKTANTSVGAPSARRQSKPERCQALPINTQEFGSGLQTHPLSVVGLPQHRVGSGAFARS